MWKKAFRIRNAFWMPWNLKITIVYIWLCSGLFKVVVILSWIVHTHRIHHFVVSGNPIMKINVKIRKLFQKRIIRDMRNQCFIYFVILSIGAILSYFLSAYIAIAALLVWLIIFFHSFNLDAEKAFEKYLIH